MAAEAYIFYNTHDSTVTLEADERAKEELLSEVNVEIEMLQGSSEPMEDGRTRYVFQVDREKGEHIRRLILRIMGHKPTQNLN